jgi:cytochrome c556
MKKFFVFVITAALILAIACRQTPVANNNQLQIDSLKQLLVQLKPGLGEYMTQFEYHHDRLGKAISEKDFERAAYETDELKETAEKIKTLQITNDKLKDAFAVFFEKYLKAPLGNLADAAEKKQDDALRNDFIALTNNCNSCHHENNMPFMKISADPVH